MKIQQSDLEEIKAFITEIKLDLLELKGDLEEFEELSELAKKDKESSHAFMNAKKNLEKQEETLKRFYELLSTI